MKEEEIKEIIDLIYDIKNDINLIKETQEIQIQTVYQLLKKEKCPEKMPPSLPLD